MRYLFSGIAIELGQTVYGSLVWNKNENQYRIIEYTDSPMSWIVDEDTIMQVQFEVNTFTDDRCDCIATSNTFTDYKDAKQFYDRLKSFARELKAVDGDGFTIEELESSYGY